MYLCCVTVIILFDLEFHNFEETLFQTLTSEDNVMQHYFVLLFVSIRLEYCKHKVNYCALLKDFLNLYYFCHFINIHTAGGTIENEKRDISDLSQYE